MSKTKKVIRRPVGIVHYYLYKYTAQGGLFTLLPPIGHAAGSRLHRPRSVTKWPLLYNFVMAVEAVRGRVYSLRNRKSRDAFCNWRCGEMSYLRPTCHKTPTVHWYFEASLKDRIFSKRRAAFFSALDRLGLVSVLFYHVVLDSTSRGS